MSLNCENCNGVKNIDRDVFFNGELIGILVDSCHNCTRKLTWRNCKYFTSDSIHSCEHFEYSLCECKNKHSQILKELYV